MKTMLQEYHEYREACYGKGALTIQQEVEVRQAFFAGCLVALNVVVAGCDMPHADAVKNLARALAEVKAIHQERIKEMEGRN